MLANIQVMLPEIPNVVVIPNTAINYSMYGESVYVLQKTKINNIYTINTRNIKPLYFGDGQTVVDGLKPDEKIVNKGLNRVTDGQLVKIASQNA